MKRAILLAQLGATLAIAAWAVLWPYPAPLVGMLLLLTPWSAQAVVATGAGSANPAMTRPHAPPMTTVLAGIPVGALLWRALNGGQLLDIQPLALVAAALAAAFGVAGWAIDKTTRPWRGLAWLAGFSLVYGASAATLIDVAFDGSAPQMFQATVLNQSITVAWTYTGHNLWLTPWGPRTQQDDVEVSAAFYAAHPPGTSVCLGLHPGVLGARWFEVRGC